MCQPSEADRCTRTDALVPVADRHRLPFCVLGCASSSSTIGSPVAAVSNRSSSSALFIRGTAIVIV
jgi:hypothetical protein